MLTSLASIQLESDSRRFGNPNRFIPVGKCSSKAKLVAKVSGSDLPRQATTPPLNDQPRVAPHLARKIAEEAKIPKAVEDGSRFGSRVTWCITRADRNDLWSWGEPRDWSKDEWNQIIRPRSMNSSG
jgi:hypothetical protein